MARSPGNPIGSVSGGGGSVSAPSSGTAFVAVTPAAGVYTVDAWYFFSGTAETLVNNCKLKTGGANLITGLPSLSTLGLIRLRFERVVADGVNPISLCTTATPTAGAIYTGLLSLTPVA